MQYLDQFVIGQESAKKALSVAYVTFPLYLGAKMTEISVFNHYNRVRANLSALEEQEDPPTWHGMPGNGRFLREVSGCFWLH